MSHEWCFEPIQIDLDASAEAFAAPGERMLGAVDRATAGAGMLSIGPHLDVRIASNPAVFRVRDLLKRTGHKFSEGLKVYRAYDLWLIMHCVSIIRKGGPRVVTIEYQVERPKGEDEYNGRVDGIGAVDWQTIELFPQTAFASRGQFSSSTQFSLGLEGEISVEPVSAAWVPLGGAVRFGTSTELAAHFEINLLTPVVQATGRFSPRAHWVLTQYAQPLAGDQVLAQIVRVPRRTEALSMDATVAIDVRDWYELWTPVPPYVRSKPRALTLAPQ